MLMVVGNVPTWVDPPRELPPTNGKTAGDALTVTDPTTGAVDWATVTGTGTGTGVAPDSLFGGHAGTYSATQAYQPGDVVTHNGDHYMAHEATTAGEEPGVSPKWHRLTLDALDNAVYALQQRPDRTSPPGGTAGQVWAKVDATDYNGHWVNPAQATNFRGAVADSTELASITNPQPGDTAATIDDGHLHV